MTNKQPTSIATKAVIIAAVGIAAIYGIFISK